MNYGQIIRQAWNLIKRTKLFILFIILFFLFPFPYFKTQSSTLSCVWFIFILISYFTFPFSTIGMILCGENAIQKRPYPLREVWQEFKKQYFRFILLILIITIPLVLFITCNGILNYGSLKNPSWISYFIFGIIYPFLAGIWWFSLFGMVIQKLSIPVSFKHGISVFFQNWLETVILVLITRIPIAVFDLISVGIYSKGTFSYSAYSQLHSFFSVDFFVSALNAVMIPFLVVMLLLAYHQFIQESDYPALQSAPSS